MRNSSSVGVGQVNKLFGQAPFRSEKVAKIFELLSLGKPMLARELAEVIGVPSKQILPRLKRYILKGWVVTQKVNNINIYSLTETARKILRLQGSNFERVKENAEKLLGRKLEQDELEILRFFFKRQGYVENSPSESIAEQVWHSLGRKIPLSRVQEILTEFTLRGILFAFRLKNGVILKVRLNRDVL
jgi:DNA-binding MarR family transcriptional regulator